VIALYLTNLRKARLDVVILVRRLEIYMKQESGADLIEFDDACKIATGAVCVVYFPGLIQRDNTEIIRSVTQRPQSIKEL
jgi:hypothetical protein